VVSGNDISNNNYAGFDAGWEAGGSKFAGSKDLVVRNNIVRDNAGPGLWADVYNMRTTFAGNTVTGNTVGIFEEISYGATITGNSISGNGRGYHVWLWGAGIAVAASPDVTVSGNHLQGNGNGIVGIQQRRGTGPQGPLVVSRLKVDDNTVTDSGLSGLGQDYDSTPDIDSRGNSVSGNRYVGGGFQHKSAIDWKTWQAAGMDRNGSWRQG
jgi:parallel beta-helix repeat protein